MLVELLKDCPKIEALMLYGINYIDMSKVLLRFSEAVKVAMLPSLKKVVILTEWIDILDLGPLTRGIFERNMAAAGVELEFFIDDRELEG